jgi:membrane protein
MYVGWSAMLFGAVVAAALPRWRVDEQARHMGPAAQRLGFGLALLAELWVQARQGGAITTATLAQRLGLSTTVVDDDLTMLRGAGFVASTVEGGWVLARTLEDATLADLYRALDLPLAASLGEGVGALWRTRIAPALRRIAAIEGDALSVPLAALIGTGTAARRPVPPLG